MFWCPLKFCTQGKCLIRLIIVLDLPNRIRTFCLCSHIVLCSFCPMAPAELDCRCMSPPLPWEDRTIISFACIFPQDILNKYESCWFKHVECRGGIQSFIPATSSSDLLPTLVPSLTGLFSVSWFFLVADSYVLFLLFSHFGTPSPFSLAMYVGESPRAGDRWPGGAPWFTQLLCASVPSPVKWSKNSVYLCGRTSES